MMQYETSPPSCASSCKELGKIPSQMSLNLGSVFRDMANIPSSWKIHFEIDIFAGNRGNGEFNGHWLALVMKHVGMNKIVGLTQHVALSEGEGYLALYMLEERDVRWHPMV
ncbi:uncharacterized protein TNCV_1368421 [Trichonephila clavipes]|nr:uncharacterized protein TNCV_1368421 [Trichonephila clavipes]